jgi:two-component system nitrate/nitrite response regulator NarL
MANEISILIVEDHSLVRNGIKLILEHQKVFSILLDEASNGLEAHKKISSNQYDMVLLDLNLPVMDGMSLIRKLKSENKMPPILVISSMNEENMIIQTLDLGVMGYLLKNSDGDELIKAVLTIKRGGKYYSNEIAQVILGAKDKHSKNEKLTNLLSKREIEIFEFVVAGNKNKDIGPLLGISSRTVEHHRKNIREKLNIQSTSGLIKFALENHFFKKRDI